MSFANSGPNIYKLIFMYHSRFWVEIYRNVCYWFSYPSKATNTDLRDVSHTYTTSWGLYWMQQRKPYIKIEPLHINNHPLSLSLKIYIDQIISISISSILSNKFSGISIHLFFFVSVDKLSRSRHTRVLWLASSYTVSSRLGIKQLMQFAGRVSLIVSLLLVLVVSISWALNSLFRFWTFQLVLQQPPNKSVTFKKLILIH